jgi:UDP-glucose 4-epimerase
MKILVTGASGRVGARLVEELNAAGGHDLTAFDLKPPAVEKPGVRYVRGSLNDGARLRQACEDVEAVAHLGAFMSWNDADAAKLYETNAGGTFSLLEALGGRKLPRFIFISTGEVYPEGRPQYLPIDEKHPTQPLSYYGMSKLLGEQMVGFYSRKFGLPATVLRISHTQAAPELLDPHSFFSGARFFLQAKLARARALGQAGVIAALEPLAAGGEKLVISRGQDGQVYRMHIADSRDIVQGIRLALESDAAAGETFNIGPDAPVSFDEAIRAMSKITGLPVVEAVLPGPAVNYETSNEKARRLLGFRPRWDFFSMLAEAAKEKKT